MGQIRVHPAVSAFIAVPLLFRPEREEPRREQRDPDDPPQRRRALAFEAAGPPDQITIEPQSLFQPRNSPGVTDERG